VLVPVTFNGAVWLPSPVVYDGKLYVFEFHNNPQSPFRSPDHKPSCRGPTPVLGFATRISTG
jgi:hypothetical protein